VTCLGIQKEIISPLCSLWIARSRATPAGFGNPAGAMQVDYLFPFPLSQRLLERTTRAEGGDPGDQLRVEHGAWRAVPIALRCFQVLAGFRRGCR
jgi:hypothetical protein